MKLAIEKIAKWGPGETVSTADRGPRWLRRATPTEAFWDLWGREKDSLKSAGITVRKRGDGTWQVCWWADPPAELPATELPATEPPATATLDLHAPPGLAYKDFQRSGIEFALSRASTLIGDEMGLGKTVQAAGVIAADKTIRRVLIVCPATLRLNWQNELRRWITREMSIGIATTKVWPATDIVICNYDIIWRAGVIEHANGGNFDLVVLDESHYVKNPKSKRARAVVGSSKKNPGLKARRKLALTGTPMTNRPVEMYSTLRWLNPGAWPSFFGFAKRYCNAQKTQWGWDFSGASNLAELQTLLRRDTMIRRRKRDVLPELLPRTRQVIEIPANGAASAVARENAAWLRHEETLNACRDAVAAAKSGSNDAAYRAAVQALQDAEGVAFSEMSTVRRETAVAKIPAALAHIKDALEATGDKIVVMAHHHEVVDAILAGLEDYRPVALTGRTPMAERQAAVDKFQTDPECRVFVGGIFAAGVGITLTAASHVVFCEIDWSPGVISQCEDRVHRIGQTNPVLIQHLVLDGSLDARMIRTIVEKQDIIAAALDDPPPPSAAPSPTPLTVEVAEPTAKSLTRVKIDDLATLVDAGITATVHASLRHLASRCDGARTEDGAGFSKLDVRTGKRLASLDALSPRQAALGAVLARRYHRQLDDGTNATVAGLLAAAKT